MNEQKEVNKNYKKKLLSAFAVLFLAGFVFAAYTVLTTTATVEIREPFEVSYAMLGDAGDWSVTNCNSSAVTWFAAPSTIDFKHIFAGEHRTLCVKVENKAEVSLPYGMNFSTTAPMVITTVDNPGIVAKFGSSISEFDVKINDDAIPSTGYTVGFGVTRG